MGRPALTVIVPATDGPQTLRAALSSIQAALDPPEEVVVVEAPARCGPAAARNDGARQATGDVLVFVDADVAVAPHAFSRIRSTFAADPGLTAVFGSYDDAPPVRGLVAEFRNLLHHHTHQRAAGPATTFWAGLGAVRREAFLAAGGFDAGRYERSSMEDVELGMRLADGGARIVLDPDLRCAHLKEWTLTQMVRSDLVARGAPWVALLLRRRSGSGAMVLGRRQRVGALASLAATAAVLARRPGAALGAAGILCAAHRELYILLARRRGPLAVPAGILLHVLHHLTAAAAVPLGVWLHIRSPRPP